MCQASTLDFGDQAWTLDAYVKLKNVEIFDEF